MRYTIPEYNEVLAYTTFLNKYPRIKKPELLNESDYPHIVFSKVGINNVQQLHRELHSKGFYKRANIRETLSGYKVADIKSIITQLGLVIKGKKEDLIDSLISQVDEDQLASLIPDEYYVISDFGNKWMSEHELEYDWHTASEDYPDFADYAAFRSQYSKYQIEMDRYLADIKNDKKSFGRYSYDGLLKLYELDGNKREATICLLKELLIDMSGALNYSEWKEWHFDRDIIESSNLIYFTPYLLKTFPKYKDFYEPSMIAQAYKLRLPVKACSLDDFRDIAEMMFDGTMDEDTRRQYISRLSQKLVEIGLSKHQS